jgi:U32 family peptidase
MHKLPELNIPAGNIEKLKIALDFGADAVYSGIKGFSLRNFAENLTFDQIAIGKKITHDAQKKLYITLNIFARNDHFEKLPDILKELANIKVDAIVISDPGIINYSKRYAPDVPIFLSTQMNVTNIESVRFWKDVGIKRIILARELSLSEIKYIRNESDIELEIFVHGSMCVSYSGRCILSDYLSSRNANLGECTQPCRWGYRLLEEKRPNEYIQIFEDEGWTYILSSKDLCMIEHIPELVESGVDAFKIEGRMRGILYLVMVTSVYRKVMDEYFNLGVNFNFGRKYVEELEKVSNREYCTGFYYGPPVMNNYETPYFQNYQLAGVVIGKNEILKGIRVDVKSKIKTGDLIDILSPGFDYCTYRIEKIIKDEDSLVDVAQPNEIVFLQPYFDCSRNSILIKKAL